MLFKSLHCDSVGSATLSVFGNHARVCVLDCLPSFNRWVLLSGCCGESRVWIEMEVGMLVKKDEQMLVCREVGGMVLGMEELGEMVSSYRNFLRNYSGKISWLCF